MKPLALSPQTKASSLRRLRRIEGQVRGLQKMVENERGCTEVMTQIASVQEALRSVARELMRHHLKHCVSDAATQGDARANAMYDELLEVIYRHLR